MADAMDRLRVCSAGNKNHCWQFIGQAEASVLLSFANVTFVGKGGLHVSPSNDCRAMKTVVFIIDEIEAYVGCALKQIVLYNLLDCLTSSHVQVSHASWCDVHDSLPAALSTCCLLLFAYVMPAAIPY